MSDSYMAKWLFLTTGKEGSFDLDGSGYYTDDDGNTITINSDGSGYYNGADGSYGSMNSDGSGYYNGADGSYGSINTDGSGYYNGADGSYSSINTDGSGYYNGADGSYGSMNSDGSGYYNGADGSYSNWNIDNYNNVEYSSSSGGSLAETLLTAAVVGLTAKAISSSQLDYSCNYQDSNSYSNNTEIEQKTNNDFSWKPLIAISIIIGVAVLGFFLFSEFNKRTAIGVSAVDLIGMDYFEVEEILMDKGFTNISDFPEYDIDIDDAEMENTLLSVSIEDNDNFNAKEWFMKESPVLIKYHAIKNIELPISAKAAKKSNYNRVKKLLKDAGFVNITTKPKRDLLFGWFNEENMVESITIDGDKKFDKKDTYRPDAEIVIIYHAYKQ